MLARCTAGNDFDVSAAFAVRADFAGAADLLTAWPADVIAGATVLCLVLALDFASSDCAVTPFDFAGLPPFCKCLFAESTSADFSAA